MSTVITLAHETDFRIGRLNISPSTRQVEAGGLGRSIEPRVMEVLVALRHADGKVLSRDDLIRLCWRGRIVTDDAIDRVIGRLRKLSGDSFRIETIRGVGYRLHIMPAMHRPRSWRLVLGASAAMVLSVIVLIIQFVPAMS